MVEGALQYINRVMGEGREGGRVWWGLWCIAPVCLECVKIPQTVLVYVLWTHALSCDTSQPTSVPVFHWDVRYRFVWLS